jgi:thymidylate synthase (FAD)
VIEHLTTQVLDHGYVILIDTMPGASGAGDQRIVDSARVSMGSLPSYVHDTLNRVRHKEERTTEQNAKLIDYMIVNEHGTPFESVQFTFLVHAPIMVARQWFRQRTASYNEVSARYSQLPNEFYIPSIERMCEQSTSNRQGSGEKLPAEVAERMRATIIDQCQNAYSAYEGMLSQGLTRELARMVLPTNIYTTWYWTVNLRNLVQVMLKLRLHTHAQYEIRAYAEAILPMAAYVAPIAMRAYDRHVLHTGVFNV